MTDGKTDTESRRDPKDADIKMAARDDSKRFYFRTPDGDGWASIPATNAELARKLAADEHPSTEPEDWEPISEEEARLIF